MPDVQVELILGGSQVVPLQVGRARRAEEPAALCVQLRGALLAERRSQAEHCLSRVLETACLRAQLLEHLDRIEQPQRPLPHRVREAARRVEAAAADRGIEQLRELLCDCRDARAGPATDRPGIITLGSRRRVAEVGFDQRFGALRNLRVRDVAQAQG